MHHFTSPRRVRKLLAVTVAVTVLFAGSGLAPAFGEGNGPSSSIYLPMVSNGVEMRAAQQTNNLTVAPVEPPLLESRPQNPNAGGEKIARTQAHIQSLAMRTADPRDMKILLICPNNQEPAYQAAAAFLAQIGIPFTSFLASQTELTSDKLFNASKALYQGVILCSGALFPTGQFVSAFDATEWQTLWDFEATFGIRQVSLYTAPGWPENYGLSIAGERYATPEAPVTATLTSAGQQVFNDLRGDAVIEVKNAYVYLSTVISPAVTTPLLVTPEGYAIASITTYSDGRQNLAITADNNPYLVHSMAMSYGILNWLTQGLFLGERHVNIAMQVDDLFGDTDLWNPNNPTLIEGTGKQYRLTGIDIQSDLNWRNNVLYTQYPLANKLKLEWAFNGEGTTKKFKGDDLFNPDTLTPVIDANQDQYNFINHTYTHLNLDAPAKANVIEKELKDNDEVAKAFKFKNYYKGALVQPDISGLGNPEFFKAAKKFGIDYIISDVSRAGWGNPSPNAGFYSIFEPSILIIPRRATNLFYPVSTPDEWTNLYNCVYSRQWQREKGFSCLNGQFLYWDSDLIYAQILDKESDMWLGYMLKWDIDPIMFHTAQVRDYDNNPLTPSVLSDLVERMIQKYHAISTLPIRNLPMKDIGILMSSRMTYNASAVSGTLTPCKSIVLSVSNPDKKVKKLVIPVTGVAAIAKDKDMLEETYGDQKISYTTIENNKSKTISLPACVIASNVALSTQSAPATDADYSPSVTELYTVTE